MTFTVAWVAGGVAQPSAYDAADDDISDLGAITAQSAWIYSQIGANLNGILILLLGLGLWRALSPDIVGRLGAGVLVAAGASTFFDGIFRLDCQGIDIGCDNVSWHSRAHKIESGLTAALTLLAPLLAFAFRRNAVWRDSWLPSLLTVPAVVCRKCSVLGYWRRRSDSRGQHGRVRVDRVRRGDALAERRRGPATAVSAASSTANDMALDALSRRGSWLSAPRTRRP